MEPLDVSYTVQRILETNSYLADVFKSNLNIYRAREPISLLVLPDDFIYRLEPHPTLHFAAPYADGIRQWSAEDCELVFHDRKAFGTLSQLMEVQTAERTMFTNKGEHMKGCFKIAGTTLWSNGVKSTFRIWPDTFQHIKVFGFKEDASAYIDSVRQHNLPR